MLLISIDVYIYISIHLYIYGSSFQALPGNSPPGPLAQGRVEAGPGTYYTIQLYTNTNNYNHTYNSLPPCPLHGPGAGNWGYAERT